MRKTHILYICIFFLQFIANQTEMDVVLNEEDSYIIYLYFFSPVYCEPDWDGRGPQWGRLVYYISVFFFSSLLRTRLRWMWSSMRKTRILYICILFSPVYCEPDWDGCGPQWGRLILPGTSTPSVGARRQSRPRPAQPEEVRVLPAALHSDHHLHQAEAPAPVLPLPYRGPCCTDGPPCACDLSSPFQQPRQDDLWWVGT